VAKAGRAQPVASPRPPRRRPNVPLRGRGRPRNWIPIAGYIAFVLIVGAAIFAWDQAYEARQRRLFAPAPPQVIVRNLIESIVGTGTVTDVTLDNKAGTLDVTIKDVLSKPGQSLEEKKKNLSTEGALAIQFVESRFRYKTMTVHLVQDGKVVATVSASGQGAPTTTYSPDLK